MSDSPFTYAAFAEFCEQFGDAKYRWDDPKICAVARYAESLGLFREWMTNYRFSNRGNFFDRIDTVAQDVARGDTGRYSDLARKLRSLDEGYAPTRW